MLGVNKCYERYAWQYGQEKEPPRDEAPSIEQLSALYTLLEEEETPFVDTAV